MGGGEDESCQWQPLKRTTHSPVTGEAWWMIISRCDRCCIGGGALTIHAFLPPSLCLSVPLLAYLGQCFNTPLTWLYWHTPDSVWWLMSIWVPLSLSLSLSFFLCYLSACCPLFTGSASSHNKSKSTNYAESRSISELYIYMDYNWYNIVVITLMLQLLKVELILITLHNVILKNNHLLII